MLLASCSYIQWNVSSVLCCADFGWVLAIQSWKIPAWMPTRKWVSFIHVAKLAAWALTQWVLAWGTRAYTASLALSA